ncbi:MAG TPA: hypothetical protein PLQ32_03110 [Flavihumibacter sp.]|nr:hypothetical protein [Bacteroidota bacterium]HPZ87066.1 hypothetical protein [Flavihumibacter sp.]
MRFEEVTGQLPLKTQLTEMVLQNRLSHALLVLGREGAGSLPIARAFAQYVVCEIAVAQGLEDACGTCAACVKAAKQVHPDIHFSYPVIPKKPGDKPLSTDYAAEWRSFLLDQPYGNLFDWLQFIRAENRQGNITAEECNDIIRKLSLKTFESKYKVLIMWMPEYLGKEGNKLLKLIEEPPPNTLFLLVAENESLVLPTIISRCQLVKVPALTDADINNYLQQQSGLDASEARQLAVISEGNLREALQQLKNADGNFQQLIRDWLNALLKNGPIALVKWIEEISKEGREKQKQFLRYFNHLLEQAIRLAALGSDSEWAHSLPPEEKDFIGRLNKMATLAQQCAIVEELDKAAYYIERNAHAKMLFHALSIKMFHILRDKARISTW